MSRPALGPIHPAIQGVPGAPSPVLKWAGRQADHSPASSAEVNAWSYNSTPPYILMAWCFVKLTGKFTYLFYKTIIMVDFDTATRHTIQILVWNSGRRNGDIALFASVEWKWGEVDTKPITTGCCRCSWTAGQTAYWSLIGLRPLTGVFRALKWGQYK
jgi:hypothetical protein